MHPSPPFPATDGVPPSFEVCVNKLFNDSCLLLCWPCHTEVMAKPILNTKITDQEDQLCSGEFSGKRDDEQRPKWVDSACWWVIRENKWKGGAG